MKAEIYTKRFMRCPNGCEHSFPVEHLFTGECAPTTAHPVRSAGPWYCDDCGQGWLLKCTADSIEVELYPSGKKRADWVILELPPQTEPVRFKIRGMRFEEDIDKDARTYFYEEHTCPTNWLRHVDEVSIGGHIDPHGLWRLVGVYDADADADQCLRPAQEVESK